MHQLAADYNWINARVESFLTKGSLCSLNKQHWGIYDVKD